MTFSDPQVVQFLKSAFIPAAIDQFEQRQQEDAEGEFYRKIAAQGPRTNFRKTTQGRYICTAGGKLLGYNNNRGSERLLEIMRQALAKFDSHSKQASRPLVISQYDDRFHLQPPQDTLVLRVHSKVLGGYEPTDDWRSAFAESVGRDNAWLLPADQEKLIELLATGGHVPDGLARRLARHHFIDNTRGEPDRWRDNDVRSVTMRIAKDGKLTGSVHLETSDASQGFQADLFGWVTGESLPSGKPVVTRFDLVAKGEFWGHGRYTPEPPRGKFPLAITFRIADGKDPADQIPPYAMKGWRRAYFE